MYRRTFILLWSWFIHQISAEESWFGSLAARTLAFSNDFSSCLFGYLCIFACSGCTIDFHPRLEQARGQGLGSGQDAGGADHWLTRINKDAFMNVCYKYLYLVFIKFVVMWRVAANFASGCFAHWKEILKASLSQQIKSFLSPPISPSEPFSSHSGKKSCLANSELRELYEQWLMGSE